MKLRLIFIFTFISILSFCQYNKDTFEVHNVLEVETNATIGSNLDVADTATINSHNITFNDSKVSFEFETGISDIKWSSATNGLTLIYNNTGSTIYKGTPLFTTGSLGDSIKIVGICSANNAGALDLEGFAADSILNNSYGFLVSQGKIYNMSTTGLTTTDEVYLSTDSSLTLTKPAYPARVVKAGHVIKVDATTGIFEVHISFGEERIPAINTYTFLSAGSGVDYSCGYYDYSATDITLTQASTTLAYGTANSARGGHPFVVCAAAGTANTGVVGLRVTGTSFVDGVRTVSDADTILSDITDVTTDEYYQGKIFIGTVTYELITMSGSPTTYSFTFNYGFADYEKFNGIDYYLIGTKTTGKAGASDTGFNIKIRHHKDTGWTYSASAFVAGNGVIAELSTDYATEDNLTNGEYFSWERQDLSVFINASSNEGFVIEVTTTAPNAVQIMNTDIIFAWER